MKRRYIKLTKEEEKLLRDGYERGTQFQFRSRCHCLLLSNSGREIKELITIFGVSRLTIYNWFDRWEEHGMAGLTNQPGQGRKKILNEKDLPIVKEEFKANHQRLEAVRLALNEKLSKEFSEITLKRFLKNQPTLPNPPSKQPNRSESKNRTAVKSVYSATD